MKIVLDEQDIIELVKGHFDDINDISFNKTNVRLTLNVTHDSKKNVKPKNVIIAKTPEKTDEPIIATHEQVRKGNVMAKGGIDRVITRVG
jgi:hypothetical protein